MRGEGDGCRHGRRDLPIDDAHALALAVKRDEDAAAAMRTLRRVIVEEFRSVSFLPLALDTNRYMRIINSTVNETVSSQRGIMASGKPIKTARELAGIPQYELAAKLGVAQSLLSNWERGEREPDERQVARALSTIRKMRNRRDVKLAEVLGEEEQA